MNNTSEFTHKESTVKENILAIVWWGLALGLVAGCALNSISGFDWVHFYYPRARDFAPKIVVNPLWVYFVVAPIALLPLRVAYGAFSLLNVGMIWLISRLSGVNRFALLFSFPALWVLWYGQIDNFVALGAALGLWAVVQRRTPLWLGVALLLLLVKPHIGAPLATLYFLWSRDWRVLATFGLVLLLSLFVWPMDWPIVWLKSLLEVASPPPGVPATAGQQTNISLYPFGLLAWLVVLLPMPRAQRAASVVAATFLSVPYAPTYSLIVLLALPVPWWVYVFSSAPLVLGPGGYWITTLAPLGYLVWIAARYLPSFIKAMMKKRYIRVAR